MEPSSLSRADPPGDPSSVLKDYVRLDAAPAPPRAAQVDKEWLRCQLSRALGPEIVYAHREDTEFGVCGPLLIHPAVEAECIREAPQQMAR